LTLTRDAGYYRAPGIENRVSKHLSKKINLRIAPMTAVALFIEQFAMEHADAQVQEYGNTSGVVVDRIGL